jgi:hypothetical protein
MVVTRIYTGSTPLDATSTTLQCFWQSPAAANTAAWLTGDADQLRLGVN